MDEPTSALTETEVDHLFRIIRELKEKQNIATIYISHKLDEIFDICDGGFGSSGTVSLSAAIRSPSMTKDGLIQMMVGRSMEDFFHKETAKIGVNSSVGE